MGRSASRSKVFISYCHEDGTYLEELKVHLAPLQRKYLFEYWDDTRLQGGEVWEDEITKALDETKIGVVLVSADFLNSSFISQIEVPALLEAAKNHRVVIIPVILRPCAFDTSPLSAFQAINSPARPLSKLRKPDREEQWEKLARRLIELSNVGSEAEQAEHGAAQERKITGRLHQNRPRPGIALYLVKWQLHDTEIMREQVELTRLLLSRNPLFVDTFGPPYRMIEEDRSAQWWEFAVSNGNLWYWFEVDRDFRLILPGISSLDADKVIVYSALREEIARLAYNEFERALRAFKMNRTTRYIDV